MALGGAFNISGLVSGLDTNSIVSKLMDLQKANLNSLTAHKAETVTQQTSIKTLQALATALKTQADVLKETGTFNVNKATSSDSDVLTATASSTAIPGIYPVEVHALAQANQLVTTTGFSDASSAVFGTGTITLGLGAATYTPITIDSTNNSLNGIVAAINKAHTSVTASVINDGGTSNNYHLVLTSSKTGASNTITMTSTVTGGTSSFPANATGASFTTLQAAQDASIKVGAGGAFTITSAANTVTNAIPGVSLNLLALSPTVGATTTPQTIQVGPDTATMKRSLTSFMSAYNTLADAFAAATYADSEGLKSGPLVSDSVALQAFGDVVDAVNNDTKSASGITALAGLGITLDAAGHLSVSDTTLLDSQLTNNLLNVQDFFTNTTTGLGARISTFLDSLTNVATGTLTLEGQFYKAEADSYDVQILAENDNLKAQQTALEAQFAAMEATLGTLQQQSQYLTAQFNAMAGTTSTSSTSKTA